MNLNLFERTIARVAPHWGLRRLGAKVALEQGLIAARHFDAARTDRRTEGWRATAGSANAELAPALKTIIRRSRDLCRNNEWSVNAKRKWVGHMIGTGIMPRPDVKAKRAKEIARDAWNAFSDNCDPEGMTDYNGMQARLAGEVFEGGSAFMRWYVRPPDFGLKVPLQCEVLEHDFLDTTRTEVLSTGNVIIHGVEFDQYGRRAAYWLFPVHPGELNGISRNGGASYVSQRVPAEQCDHVFRVDRAGQVTGVPWLAPTMLRLRDAADYEEAELVRKKIEACFTVFVRREGGAMSGVAQAVDQGTDPKNAQRKIEKIGPGLVAYVDNAGDITTAEPKATTDGGHMQRQLYAFAAGIGLGYSQVSGNLSDVNFTSLREGKLDNLPVLEQAQWHMMIPQAVRPAWRRVMRVASAVGLQVKADTPAKYATPKRPWVNPADDLKAEQSEMALGLESWAEKVTSRGYDPDDLLDEIVQWKPKLEAAGIKFAAAPGMGGGKAGADADTKPGNGKDKPGKPGGNTDDKDQDDDEA